MSRCFTWFLISSLGEPNMQHQSVWITRMCGGFDFVVFLGGVCFRGGLL